MIFDWLFHFQVKYMLIDIQNKKENSMQVKVHCESVTMNENEVGPKRLN